MCITFRYALQISPPDLRLKFPFCPNEAVQQTSSYHFGSNQIHRGVLKFICRWIVVHLCFCKSADGGGKSAITNIQDSIGQALFSFK
jgi:hypothetical protein